MTLFYNKPWPFLYEGDWLHDQDEEEEMSKCDVEDCTNSGQHRWLIKVGKEYLFVCYEHYLKRKEEEGENNKCVQSTGTTR